jgi:6-phosphofructokinase 1
MDILSHVITPNITTLHHSSSSLRYSNSRHFRSFRVTNNVRVFSQLKNQNNTTLNSTDSDYAIDYNDPDWKSKFKENFEARFRLPHVTDTFPHAESMPSTFCLKMRFVIVI